MNDNSVLEEKLHHLSVDELTQYIYNNVDVLTTSTFSALKKEIALRKDLPNDVKMLIGNIQDLRNQNFINEILPYLYTKNRKIKTVEDLIADLRKNEIPESDITSLLYQLPKIIEINNTQYNFENSIKLLWLISCILISFISLYIFTKAGIIIFLFSIIAIVYIIFSTNEKSRIEKLKKNIEFYLENLKPLDALT
ncbi:hypothetical protein [Flavobacterium sp. 83]|uniref:hypothetical protein n=1 Tax=Flavobacterium sp. 83 TaxID=1131812 RepID=UPI0005590A04|nr:hypothetical protein [Flavobacterium sp. 83]